jgi:hypothetical protein
MIVVNSHLRHTSGGFVKGEGSEEAKASHAMKCGVCCMMYDVYVICYMLYMLYVIYVVCYICYICYICYSVIML